MRRRSLRRRLLVLLFAATVFTWLAAATAGYVRSRQAANELLDEHLSQAAALLVAQAGGELEEIDLEHAPGLDRSQKVAFQIWEEGRRLRLHSSNAPNERLSPVTVGFSDTTHDAERWRVYSAWDAEREFLIQVGERTAAREEIAAGLGASLLLPLALALPLLAIGIWWSVRDGLRPLEQLRDELSQRDPQRLVPLEAADAPAELQPMMDEINRLFKTIDDLITRERRFTADAAHELRSPLAALGTQAQVARSAIDEARRVEALDALYLGSQRAARLIEQLLTLARLESGSLLKRGRCDLREIVRQRIAEQAQQALDKSLEVSLTDGTPVWMDGDPGLLEILARNLVDNALQYTPTGGQIEADVGAGAGAVYLRIRNSGPRPAPEVLARLGERFYRAAAAGETGSGLGLSIVQRVAQLHSGRVRYEPGPDGSGFMATVEFDVPR